MCSAAMVSSCKCKSMHCKCAQQLNAMRLPMQQRTDCQTTFSVLTQMQTRVNLCLTSAVESKCVQQSGVISCTGQMNCDAHAVCRQGLIAVNYAARAAGITRHMRVDQALKACPELQCLHVEVLGTRCHSLCSALQHDLRRRVTGLAQVVSLAMQQVTFER